MKKDLKIFISCIFGILLVSCQGKVDPEFIGTQDFGLQVKDVKVFTYDALTWQTAFNREKREFRVHTDNMSDYYCVTLNTVPSSEGQKVKGSIVWTSSSDVITKSGLNFSVEKIDRAGRIWLWCKKERIGAVIQALD